MRDRLSVPELDYAQAYPLSGLNNGRRMADAMEGHLVKSSLNGMNEALQNVNEASMRAYIDACGIDGA
jgi:hypothetical protein